MGNFPQVKPPAGIPIQLSTPAYLMDHHFQGSPVLPAVEAMEALARAAEAAHPDLNVHHITDIRFDKFLYLDPARNRLDALAEMEPSRDNDRLQVRLTTRTRAPGAAITRTKVHASLSFSPSTAGPDAWPMDVAAAIEGVCVKVPPEKLYGELVPFGPAYQNIVAPVLISPDGALACIRTPDMPHPTCLGSPFALDAALHAACAWSQYYQGLVAFPVAMERRIIVRPTRPGKTYYGRLRPGEVHDDLLIVDIELLDEQGGLCESISGVRMRDVSGGRLQPPQWFTSEARPDPLEAIRKQCIGLTVVELDTAAPFAPRALTPLEKERLDRMGPRRRRSYLAARLALKRLFRRCRDQGTVVPGEAIATVSADSPLPRCCALDGSTEPELHCSVSHDRRLAIAVAHTGKVGVDIEKISPKALKSKKIFMHEKELLLIGRSPLGNQKAALIVWSVKEAVAKAFGMNLADAWQAVRVTELSDSQSRYTLGGKNKTADHAMVDNHLVTLVVGEQTE